MNRIRANIKLIALLTAASVICLSAVYFLFVAEAKPPSNSVFNAPNLMSPIKSVAVQSMPELVWSQVKSASTYEVQIVSENPIRTVCSKRALPASQASYGLQANEALAPGIYHWRVRAVDNLGKAGMWSEDGIFIVQ